MHARAFPRDTLAFSGEGTMYFGSWREQEKRDAIDAAIGAAIIAAFWILLRGWRPGLAVFTGDGLQYIYPYFSLVGSANPGTGFFYDPSWLGGVKLDPVWIRTWYEKLAFAAGLAPIDALTVCLVIPQWLFGFASLKLVDGLLSAFAPKRSPLRGLERAAWLALFSLAPVLGLRIAAGHMYYSNFLMLSAAAIVCGLKRKAAGFFGLGLLFAGLLACVESCSYPFLVNGILFGGPLLALLIWELRPWNMREAACVAFVALAAFLWAIPGQIEPLVHFSGSDTSRTTGGIELVYSIATSNWRDWLASLTWNPFLFSSGRVRSGVHETIWPIGPILLFLALGCATRARKLCAATLATLALCILFASRIEPFASLVLGAAPVLLKFRAPARAIFPILLIAAPVAVAALRIRGTPEVKAKPRQKSEAAILLLLGGAIFAWLPGAAGELLAWAGALALVLEASGWLQFTALRRLVLIGLVAGGAVAGLNAGLPPNKIDLAQTEANARAMRAQILAAAPALADPLTRATFAIVDQKFYSNTAKVIGIASLNGYWQPLRRFNELFNTATGNPPGELHVNRAIAADHSATPFLASLYNIAFDIRKSEAGELEVIPLKGAAGPLWLTGAFRPFQSLEEAVAYARKPPTSAPRDRPWFIATDAFARPHAATLGALPACATRPLLAHRVTSPYFAIEADIGEGPPCALVFSLNFAESLRAYDKKYMSPLPVVPVYGALAAVLVATNTQTVLLRAEPIGAEFLPLFKLIATLMLTLSAIWALRPPIKKPKQARA